MHRIISTICLLAALSWPNLSNAQTSYRVFLENGKAAYNTLNFEAAINQFEAAKISSPPADSIPVIDDWIQKSQRGYIDAITAARDAAMREERAKDSALVIAQTNELLLISGNEREAERYEVAMILAYAGRKNADERSINNLETTFGQAVYQYFSKTISLGQNAPIYSFAPESFREQVLFEASQGLILGVNANALLQEAELTISTLDGHKDYIEHLATNTQGAALVSSGMDSTAFVWDIERGSAKALSNHRGRVLFSTISNDAQQILTCSADGTANVWSKNGELLQTLSGHQGPIYQGSFLPNGKIATRSFDHSVMIWKSNGQIDAKIQSAEGAYLSDYAYLPNSQLFLTLNKKGSIEVFNKKGELSQTYKNVASPILRFTVSAEDNVLLLTEQNQLLSYNPISGIVNKDFLLPFDNTSFLKYEQDVEILIAASSSGNILLRWPNDQELTIAGDGPVLDVKINKASDHFLVTTTDGKSRLYDQKGTFLYEVDLNSDNPIPSVFSADGHFLVAAIDDNSSIRVSPIPEVAWSYLNNVEPTWQSTLVELTKKLKEDQNIDLERILKE